MDKSIFSSIGEQLRGLRKARGISQPALAERTGRDRARISELERDLLRDRWGRDRLTLFAEICDILDVVPILVPRSRASEIRDLVADPGAPIDFRQPVRSTFDELFVDLGEPEEDDD